MQTIAYVAPSGSGFRVIGTVTVGGFTARCVRNHGPDTKSEQGWPAEGVEAAAAAFHSSCIDKALATVNSAYPSLVISDGLQKIAQHTAAGTLATIPKTIAAATWVQTVKTMALAGNTNFPPAPFTVAEVLAE